MIINEDALVKIDCVSHSQTVRIFPTMLTAHALFFTVHTGPYPVQVPRFAPASYSLPNLSTYSTVK